VQFPACCVAQNLALFVVQYLAYYVDHYLAYCANKSLLSAKFTRKSVPLSSGYTGGHLDIRARLSRDVSQAERQRCQFGGWYQRGAIGRSPLPHAQTQPLNFSIIIPELLRCRSFCSFDAKYAGSNFIQFNQRGSGHWA